MFTATDSLWRNHANELLKFATVLVGPGDASDVVAEVFLRAERGGMDDVEAVRAFLFRAVVNHANDLRRARSRRWARDLAAIGPAQVD